MRDYFPTVLATGKAFCNRKSEIEHLRHNIDTGTPTLLASPRRYGKTSLALYCLEKSKCPYIHIDLYKALNEQDIAEYILNGIGILLGKIEKTPTKLIKMANAFFSSLQLKFTVSDSIAVELSRKQKKPSDLILTALEQLDKLVMKHASKQTAVLFLDEFQVLSEVTKNKAIEAVIREAMQKAVNVRYLFAGSNRHLIERMFNDDSRPFFNSCDQINLRRISKDHYVKQINKASKEKWGELLPTSAIDTIFSKTKYHPYYINKLCSTLIRSKCVPDIDDVEEKWNLYVSENISRVQQEISLLKINQRKLLIHIAADDGVESPYSKEYSDICGMPPTSIHRSMEFLLEHDYVWTDDENKFRILDPLIESVLEN